MICQFMDGSEVMMKVHDNADEIAKVGVSVQLEQAREAVSDVCFACDFGTVYFYESCEECPIHECLITIDEAAEQMDREIPS